jgi:hypothetical protein
MGPMGCSWNILQSMVVANKNGISCNCYQFWKTCVNNRPTYYVNIANSWDKIEVYHPLTSLVIVGMKAPALGILVRN